MKKGNEGKGGGVLALMAFAACVLLLAPVAGRALTVCATPPVNLCTDPTTEDCDGDGLTNKEECVGFPALGTQRSINGYNSGAADKLDPCKPDLFFMVTDMNGVNLASTSLLSIALSGNSGAALDFYADNLSIKTHLVNFADTTGDRQVAPGGGKAAWIRESTSTTADGTWLAKTPESAPSYPNVYTTVYTQKIKNNVDTKCPTSVPCFIKKGTQVIISKLAGEDNAPIRNYFIKQVISHEMGHGSKLATANTDSYYHYSRSSTIMDPSVTFKSGVYTIPTVFDPVKDPPAVTLK